MRCSVRRSVERFPLSQTVDPLARHAASQPDKPAVVVDSFGGARPSTTTFGEMNALVNMVAAGLRRLGVTAGDRVVWCGPNSLEVVAVVHAARKASLTAVPLSYRFVGDEMRYVIDNSDASVVLIDAEQAAVLAQVCDDLPKLRHVVVFGASTSDDTPFPTGRIGSIAWIGWSQLIDGCSADEPEPTGATAGAAMIYTSGTTGRPKGALRTRSDLSTVAAMMEKLRLGRPDDVHLTTGPLYHSGPLAWASLAHTSGQTIVVLRRFDARRWIELVAEHGVTNTFTAPTQMKRVMALPAEVLDRAALASMRSLVINAAPVPYALKVQIIERFGDGFLFEVYGSTEIGVTTILEPADQLRKPGSCGRPYGPIEVRVVGPDGLDVPTGEPGELFIRSRLVIDGYHATTEQLTAIPASGGATGDRDGGWFSVGDVARIDEEGYVSICDRLKDMIISGGVNIYPAEIEAVLHEHPEVLDVGVFGLPDDEWGEVVHAVVAPRPGSALDADELAGFVSGRLAAYKRPRSYELRAELPRTEAGKLLKRQLRDEHLNRRGS
jgi:acyl-CoA synthetase (AMP-forming)/AMP-acid ligase II